MRRVAVLLALASALLAPAAGAAPVADGPYSVTDLRVEGGAENWRADGTFLVRWDWTSASGSGNPSEVRYRVYNPRGNLALAEEIYPFRETVVRLHSGPGLYRMRITLANGAGEEGPAAEISLRFDDSPPPAPAVAGPASWIDGEKEAALRITRPHTAPPSGIRGYAISLDRGVAGSPCARPRRCAAEEIDLGAGSAERTLSLGTLPEGSNFARVVAVSGAGVPSAATSTALIRVDSSPPMLVLAGAPSGWAAGPVHLTATASDRLSGMAPGGSEAPFTAIAVDGGAPSAERGGHASTWVGSDGVHRVEYFARDAVGNADDGAPHNPAPATTTVRIDSRPPAVTFLAAQDPTDPERIEAAVADSLSGPSAIAGSIAVRPAGSAARFTPIPTAVRGARLVGRWGSDSFPTGRYEFRATGYDAAGNAAATGLRASGFPMVLANPVKRPAAIEAGFGGARMVWQRCHRTARGRRCHRQTIDSYEARPSGRSIPYGRGMRLGGRLRSLTGAPLAGTAVTVVETFAAGAHPRRRATVVRTDARGTFRTRLEPGPSRTVSVRFAGNRTHAHATARTLHLAVQAAVRMRASTSRAAIGGAPVRFSGRVVGKGASIPRRGRPVELQFRYPGAEWSEFRTVRTDTRGRFRYAYSFSDDDSRGVRFQFRALAPAEDDWPYEAAYSRPIAVTGH